MGRKQLAAAVIRQGGGNAAYGMGQHRHAQAQALAAGDPEGLGLGEEGAEMPAAQLGHEAGRLLLLGDEAQGLDGRVARQLGGRRGRARGSGRGCRAERGPPPAGAGRVRLCVATPCPAEPRRRGCSGPGGRRRRWQIGQERRGRPHRGWRRRAPRATRWRGQAVVLDEEAGGPGAHGDHGLGLVVGAALARQQLALQRGGDAAAEAVGLEHLRWWWRRYRSPRARRWGQGWGGSRG